jgi:hypothetical protein
MPRGPLGLAFVSVALAVLLFAWPSAAQRVVVLRPAGVDPVLSEAFNRLRAELALQDFDVIVLDAEGSELDADTLSELARREQAFAGISLSRRVESASADVCIADRVTGKVSQRTLSLSDAKDAPAVLAVRAVDLLRSSLREFGPDERASSDVVGVDRGPVPEAVHDWTRAPPSSFRLGASAMALLAEPRLGVAFGPTLSLRARSSESLTLGVVLSGPLVGAELAAGGGRAVLRQELILGEITWTLASNRRFELAPAFAVGAYHLDAKGEAVPPLLSQSEQVWSFALGAGVEAGVRLSERVVVTCAVRALSLSPRPAVAVRDDRQNFAPVIALANLGLGVEF